MVLPVLDEKTSIRIDFIFSFTEYEKQAIERSKKIKFDNQEVNFATPEDTIIHKIFSGRGRDLEDIRTIIIKQKNWIRNISDIGSKSSIICLREKSF